MAQKTLKKAEIFGEMRENLCYNAANKKEVAWHRFAFRLGRRFAFQRGHAVAALAALFSAPRVRSPRLIAMPIQTSCCACIIPISLFS
ncbi:MAG: hypothetical protein K2N70_07565, partial [Helicobacter sp.]|nr:hypothetical protein [Helicobacter sp.]